MSSTWVLLLLVVLVALVGVGEGHICIIHPRQVGPMNISIPGSHDCYRRTAYCGGFTDGPITVFPSGQTVEVTMQQNLNHFNPGKPGKLLLLFSTNMNPSSGDWNVLDSWDDFAGNDMVQQTNFTRTVTFPDIECNPCLFGAQYVSYNQYEIDPPSNTNAIFYNCANIALQKQGSIDSSIEPQPQQFVEEEKEEKKEEDDQHNCCSPDVWEGEGVGFDYNGQYNVRIVYDATLKRTRFDRRGVYEPLSPRIDSTVITFYDSGPPFYEYVIDHNLKTCRIYGADEFYPWCFGSDRNQQFIEKVDFEDEDYLVWRNPSNDFTWTSHAGSCLPRTVHHQSSSYSLERFRMNFNATHMFDLPSYCNAAKFEDPCNKKDFTQ